MRIIIPKPTEAIVRRYLEKWDSLENYVLQENSLNKLFINTYPNNTNIDEVLIKVCSLNTFYSTNIFSPFTVAKHIVALDIDKKLSENNLDLVNDIAEVKMNGGKVIKFYSFATKYCSHHNPEQYPIYDSFVEKVLLHFKKEDNFYQFNKQDFRVYPRFRQILNKFSNFYKLNNFNLKQIDQYLWQIGKEYFPKNY